MRRWWIGAAVAVLLASGAWFLPRLLRRVEAPIMVGLIHSRTGPLEVVEGPMLDAELLAIEEINAAGGLLGRRVVGVVADGHSAPATFGREAHRLVDDEKVVAVFGGLTASCRLAIEEVTTPAKLPFFFPGSYEGLVLSMADVIGTGPLPNQQAIPAVSCCFDALKARRFFLAGIEDASSYAVHEVIRDQLRALGGEVVGEAFVGIDGSGTSGMVAAIKAAGADVVISSVVGDANKGLLRQMTAAGLTAEKQPMVCLRVSEDDLRRIPAEDVAGRYAAWAYFQSIDDEFNRRLVDRFKARYGAEHTVSDPAVSAYFAVKLWAQAVEEGESTGGGEVRERLARQSLETAGGVVSVDPEQLHTWRPIRVGKFRGDGQIEQVWALDRPIRPVAFPLFRFRDEWIAALTRWRTTGKPGVGPQAAPPEPAPAPAPSPGPSASAGAEGRPVVWGPLGVVRSAPAAPVPAARSASTPPPRGRPR